jgi:hypothetical protein
MHPKINMESQKTLNSQSNMDNKNKAGGTTIPDSKTYYRVIATKMASCWHRQMEWNRNPRNKPCIILS